MRPALAAESRWVRVSIPCSRECNALAFSHGLADVDLVEYLQAACRHFAKHACIAALAWRCEAGGGCQSRAGGGALPEAASSQVAAPLGAGCLLLLLWLASFGLHARAGTLSFYAGLSIKRACVLRVFAIIVRG